MLESTVCSVLEIGHGEGSPLSTLQSTLEAFEGIESFSHLWVLAWLGEGEAPAETKTKVRAPRLGGTEKIGVFATRSPHRPNPIGLSLVELVKVRTGVKSGATSDSASSHLEIYVRGGDWRDGTWILDIKPYVTAYDRVERSRDGWTQEIEPPAVPIVVWDPEVQASLAGSLPNHLPGNSPHDTSAEQSPLRFLGADQTLESAITAVLKQDPRPAHQRGTAPVSHSRSEVPSPLEYAAELFGFDVRWEVTTGPNEPNRRTEIFKITAVEKR